ncbi:MAG: molybdopterin cofactor-binding domain-containing protein [Acidobacteriota bacterium]|nr:molybdopterin cofactor-binding domain-containing protein [Acidobacteriota bacterium]
MASAAKQVEATYRVPYLAHAAMEPLNCTAWVREDGADVWTGTQNFLHTRAMAADVTGLDADSIEVHSVMLGGGFGRRGMFSPDYVRQGVDVARHVPYPVKTIWSREDDMRRDAYRPAITARLAAGVDAGGAPTAWLNDHIGKNEPSEAAHIPYGIANTRIRYADDGTHIPFGNWRSVAHSQHAFFTEAFFDEMAEAADRDPYELRRELLADRPEMIAVLDAAAKAGDWGEEMEPGRGRGIAIAESFGSIVAQVAEVTVDAETGVKVNRVVCAADTGEVIHPDGLEAQLESGIVFALSAALFGEITIKNGRVVERNFPDYPMVKMADMPLIETLLVPSGRAIGGGGEVGTPPLAPAVVNAIFAATGQRVRELPLRKSGLT